MAQGVQTGGAFGLIFRYLSAFDYKAAAGSAVIPRPSAYLKGLVCVNKDLLSFVQHCRGQEVLDMDANETHKSEALSCYKGS